MPNQKNWRVFISLLILALEVSNSYPQFRTLTENQRYEVIHFGTIRNQDYSPKSALHTTSKFIEHNGIQSLNYREQDLN